MSERPAERLSDHFAICGREVKRRDYEEAILGMIGVWPEIVVSSFDHVLSA
ncbi:MAG TPA: hypothetical protein VEZ11_19220 [Thermoanaerobaculia bacterium]|nr:hypothetical protein [Thermoanaerobaculia bacterium]